MLCSLLHLYVATAAKGAFERFDLNPPPRIVIRADSNMQRGEVARAVLFEGGKEEIWVSRAALDNPALNDAMDHESAHLRAWRDHGPEISTHGREWRNACKSRAANPGKACRPVW